MKNGKGNLQFFVAGNFSEAKTSIPGTSDKLGVSGWAIDWVCNFSPCASSAPEAVKETKFGIKVAHWLNMLCRCGGVSKWRNCYQCNVNVMQLPTCTFIYRNLSTQKTGQRIVTTSIQLTFQCGYFATDVASLEVPRHWLSEVHSVKLLVSDKSGHSKCSDRPTVKKLTMVIRAQDGHAECCLNWNVYDISVNC